MEATSRTCRWVARRLPLLAGDDLIGADRRKVERHLIGCAACRGRHDASMRSVALLQEIGSIALGAESGDSPSLWPALARQIREAKHEPARPIVAPWRPRFAVLTLGSGLAAALIFGLAWHRPALVPPVNRVDGLADQVAAERPAVSQAPVEPATPAKRSFDFESIRHRFDLLELAITRAGGVRPAPPLADPNPASPAPLLGTNPFEPPLPLWRDFDLDRGTLAGPTIRDTQRAY